MHGALRAEDKVVDGVHIRIYGVFRRGLPSILVLPNNYGLLPYVDWVCRLLFDLGSFNVATMSFSGMGRSSGQCTLASATTSLLASIRYLAALSGSLKPSIILLAHCSGLYPVLEASKIGQTTSVLGLVVYHYLHTPSRLYEETLRTMTFFGVRLVDEPLPKDYDAVSGLCGIHHPVTLIHPILNESDQKATDAELGIIQRLCPSMKLVRPMTGYNITPTADRREVADAVTRDILPSIIDMLGATHGQH